MKALTTTRLASLVDDKKLHAQLLKVAALAAPIVALQTTLVDDPAVDYEEDRHEQPTNLKDMIDLLRHLTALGEASLEFAIVLEGVEQSPRRIRRPKEFLRQMKRHVLYPLACYEY